METHNSVADGKHLLIPLAELEHSLDVDESGILDSELEAGTVVKLAAGLRKANDNLLGLRISKEGW